MGQLIDRCQCCDKTFAEIKACAERLGTTSVRRLKRELNMAPYCSACREYLEKALTTGQTVFEVQDPRDADPTQ